MATTTEIAAKGDSTGAIHCLTIPLHKEFALLPNATIAEIVSYKPPEVIEDVPDWFLGYLNWRDKRVPVISFESLSGGDVQPPKKNSRIAILNTLNGNPQIPYIGILSQGIPGLALVQKAGLQGTGNVDENRKSISAFVKVGGAEALIPNIDEIEERLITLHLT